MKIRFSANILPLSWLIRLWCFSKVSHVEFIFSNGDMIYPAVETGHTILTRNKEYFQEYEFELDITKKEEQILRKWAESQIGVPYDYTALAPLNVLIPRKKKFWKDDIRWMCSEFCAYGLELVGIKLFPDDYRKVTPSDLMKALEKSPRAKLIREETKIKFI